LLFNQLFGVTMLGKQDILKGKSERLNIYEREK